MTETVATHVSETRQLVRTFLQHTNRGFEMIGIYHSDLPDAVQVWKKLVCCHVLFCYLYGIRKKRLLLGLFFVHLFIGFSRPET